MLVNKDVLEPETAVKIAAKIHENNPRFVHREIGNKFKTNIGLKSENQF